MRIFLLFGKCVASVLKMEGIFQMPRLFNMAAQLIAKHVLALLMLFAVCAPYVHAAAEFGHHEECGMEMCKRAGKCCCRRTNPGKPHWSARDLCHPGAAQMPGVSSPVVAVLGASRIFTGLTVVAERFATAVVTAPITPFAIVRFQRPPPQLF